MAEVKGDLAVKDKLAVDGNAKFNKGLDSPYLELNDTKATNTAGGTFTQGAWQTRDLNFLIHNDFASTVTPAATAGDGGQFIIPAGIYHIEASAPALSVGDHAARLADVTDAAGQLGDTVILGTTEHSADSSPSSQTRSKVTGRFTIARSTTLEVQHRCEVTQADDGFGSAAGFYQTNNVFTVVKMWQVRADS